MFVWFKVAEKTFPPSTRTWKFFANFWSKYSSIGADPFTTIFFTSYFSSSSSFIFLLFFFGLTSGDFEDDLSFLFLPESCLVLFFFTLSDWGESFFSLTLSGCFFLPLFFTSGEGGGDGVFSRLTFFFGSAAAAFPFYGALAFSLRRRSLGGETVFEFFFVSSSSFACLRVLIFQNNIKSN